MGLSIPDIVALAKAGYKPGDVKELITLSEKVSDPKPEEQPAATAEPSNPATESAEPEKAPENVETDPEPEKEVNYKELYEKSQNDLKAAQEANRKQDASGNAPDPSEDLKTIIASYL